MDEFAHQDEDEEEEIDIATAEKLEAELEQDPDLDDALQDMTDSSYWANHPWLSLEESRQRVSSMLKQHWFFRGQLEGFFAPDQKGKSKGRG